MQDCLNFFKDKLINQYGEEITNKIFDGFYSNRKTTFRVNTLKSSNEEVEEFLKNENISYSKVNWFDKAYIIEDDNINTQDWNIYKEGKIYLQSLSSMIPPIILEPKENNDILDMAAAPGGKTTQIATITNNKAHITACELNSIRIEKLKYNIEKQGAKCINIMKKDARNLDDFFSFDQILLDAPCSGSGTILLKYENTYKYFSQNLISKSTKAQKALLNKAIKLLKKGNTMVYSTCSILQEENEDIIKEFIDKNLVEVVEINEYDFESELPVKIPGTKCIYPSNLFEGFFIAKLRKK